MAVFTLKTVFFLILSMSLSTTIILTAGPSTGLLSEKMVLSFAGLLVSLVILAHWNPLCYGLLRGFSGWSVNNNNPRLRLQALAHVCVRLGIFITVVVIAGEDRVLFSFFTTMWILLLVLSKLWLLNDELSVAIGFAGEFFTLLVDTRSQYYRRAAFGCLCLGLFSGISPPCRSEIVPNEPEPEPKGPAGGAANGGGAPAPAPAPVENKVAPADAKVARYLYIGAGVSVLLTAVFMGSYADRA